MPPMLYRLTQCYSAELQACLDNNLIKLHIVLELSLEEKNEFVNISSVHYQYRLKHKNPKSTLQGV